MQQDCETYFTIKFPTTGLYKEKGSKFLANACSISSIDEAKNYHQEVKKKYYDAKNFCFAYAIGLNYLKTRVYDDHEPTHIAGTPILNQIKSYGLSDIIVTVTRYYGGKKLGISGLIHAFSEATADALEQAIKIERYETTDIQLSFGYDALNLVMQLIKTFKIKILNQSMIATCEMQLQVKSSDLPILKQVLKNNYTIKLKDL